MYGGPATVGEYAVVTAVVAAGSESERAVGSVGLGWWWKAEAAVCTESTWADSRRGECWELEVGGALRSSFRETSACWDMPRLSSRRVQCADSASSVSVSVGGVVVKGVDLSEVIVVVGLVVVVGVELAEWWWDCDCLHAINDERRLAVVEGDSRAGDGLDITVASYRGQSVCEYGPSMQRKGRGQASKGREGVRSVEARRLYRTRWCK